MAWKELKDKSKWRRKAKKWLTDNGVINPSRSICEGCDKELVESLAKYLQRVAGWE